MRILAKEIDEKLNRFPRPPNQMYIDEILNGPNLLGDITKEQDKDQSMPTVPYQTHQDGHIWGQDPSSPYQSYNERSPEPIAEDQDEEMDSQRNNRKSIEMKSPEMKSPEMMSPEPRASSRYPQRNTTQRTTLRKPPHRDSAVGLPVTDKGKRVKKDDTPVEAEEDMDDLTPPRETKRKKAESDEEFKSSTDDEVGTPPLLRSPKSARTRIDDLSGAGSSRRGRQPATTSPSPSPSEGRAPKKARQPTRHWTEEEIERLNELVEDPRFIYHGDEQGSRKRDFKWSRIKAWDQKHGNILKNRTPVNLKDKYRDMNDKGAHRRLVMERLVKKKEGSPSPSTATATATTTTTTTATAGGSRFAKLRTRPM
ncbi:hypothetical protein B0O80DRAFT_168031 [Mortierella sp. GBAus27b]|nr:hypothetical protein B0O80DRAFT_168031 [Mortierella sp. GBAus27b]